MRLRPGRSGWRLRERLRYTIPDVSLQGESPELGIAEGYGCGCKPARSLHRFWCRLPFLQANHIPGLTSCQPAWDNKNRIMGTGPKS